MAYNQIKSTKMFKVYKNDTDELVCERSTIYRIANVLGISHIQNMVRVINKTNQITGKRRLFRDSKGNKYNIISIDKNQITK